MKTMVRKEENYMEGRKILWKPLIDMMTNNPMLSSGQVVRFLVDNFGHSEIYNDLEWVKEQIEVSKRPTRPSQR